MLDIGFDGTNVVSHLNHINPSNIGKLQISQQFLACRLQWYHNTDHSLETCGITAKNPAQADTLKFLSVKKELRAQDRKTYEFIYNFIVPAHCFFVI